MDNQCEINSNEWKQSCPYDDPECNGKHNKIGSSSTWCPSAREAGRAASRERNRRQRATPEGREASREASRRWREKPGKREVQREAQRRILVSETTCPAPFPEACTGIAPVGKYYCPPCHSRAALKSNQKTGYAADRRRREALNDAVYEDIKYDELYVRDGGRCAWCDSEVAYEDGEVEHVISVARFHEYAQGNPDVWSGLVLSCIACNRGPGGKFDRDASEWVLWRWRQGLPVVQSIAESSMV